MFDNDAVIADMRKIFSKTAPGPTVVTPPADPAPVDPISEVSPPPSRLASLFGRIDGVATIGFAAFVALVGVIAVPLLHEPAPASASRASVTPDLSTPTPPFPVDHAIAPPPAGSLPVAIVSASVARSAVRQERRATRVHHVRRPLRRYRRQFVQGETPHLTGEALRRALAEDAVLTRHLNVEALRKLPAAAGTRGIS
ncbi:hypothetical protein ASG67_17110 [Sphingomonas sp. Leaf339]|uniref:hypothetical protein n=1 Tax=Sphingomonas sp. Leaf339 TaxID=1736343 RepID=UPI000701554D|nr:hypothetical protein [Sphingomonas sp. Leaf339]KQU58049.1 hypothetical protein ASG67_17110 [Sphingomonas sp. Leaf339]